MSRTSSPGAKNPDPLDIPPIGTSVERFGEPWVVTGYSDVTGCPTFAVKSAPLHGDQDGFEVGTPSAEKARTLRTEAKELASRARQVPAGPERDWALLQARRYLRRSHALAGSTRLRTRASGRHEARPARPGGARRTSSSSRTSSADPGESDPSDRPEPRAARLCEACAADISHRRADAKTCGQNCRKDKSRGKVAPAPSPVIRIDRPLEDEIAGKAWQRHLAWARDVRPGVRDDLTREIEDLYAELRRRRAHQPLPEFEGSIASYDFDSRAARLWRHPGRRASGAVTTKQLKAVAA